MFSCCRSVLEDWGEPEEFYPIRPDCRDEALASRFKPTIVQGLGLDFTYGIAICSCALQLWVGRFLISNRKANGGEIITALFVVILSSLGLNQAAINFYSFEQGRIAAYKLFEMISCSNSSLNQDGSTLATMQGNIEFRNVYFSYLSRPEILILSGFYQNVPARKIVALVGRNDSRKSSIIPLMECFYDLTLGEEPTLLSLSIKDNIAYGRSTTSDQIEEAAKTIHAHDFITSLEMGYETQVGRTGLTLTEEQKIKISIARVVLSNPSILLLDEFTSGLDFEAEKVVQETPDILIYMAFALDCVKSLQCAFSHLHKDQMDCKKFLQFIKEKNKRILDHKEASLKWKRKLKAWLFVNFLV
ncbi:hypothetical protein ZIOFF_047755 [Zingiber officinale]|uniref:ABC transporter domain-containing protein n=1 Tax=Zingiber officinale TaxID=94328 RepID=A0A8J5FQ19_ZINOF|nr:hypothetical protein ZIOFF_047755 [Zingiber officinale]